MIRISMDVSGAVRVLGAMGARLADMTHAMQDAGRIVHRSVMRNFALGGRPRWKPLKDGSGRRPLVRTGRLRDSISWKASPTGVSIGTGLRYAAVHQFGGRAGRAGRAGRGLGSPIPARPYLVLQPEDHQAVTKAISDYLTGGSAWING